MTPQDMADELEIESTDLALACDLPSDRRRQVLWSASLPFGCVAGAGRPL